MLKAVHNMTLKPPRYFRSQNLLNENMLEQISIISPRILSSDSCIEPNTTEHIFVQIL